MTQLDRHRPHGPGDGLHPLVESARDVERACHVAQVVAQLALGHAGRVAPERHAAGGIEAVHRLHQADGRHLREILERLARGFVPAGDTTSDRKEAPQQLALGLKVAVLVPADQKAPLLGPVARPAQGFG